MPFNQELTGPPEVLMKIGDYSYEKLHAHTHPPRRARHRL